MERQEHPRKRGRYHQCLQNKKNKRARRSEYRHRVLQANQNAEVEANKSTTADTDGPSIDEFHADALQGCQLNQEFEYFDEESDTSFYSEKIPEAAETTETKITDENWIENGTDPLYHGANVSNLEAFLSIITFIHRFKLTGVCVKALLKLLQLLLPADCKIPESQYLFYNSIPADKDVPSSYQVHYYCEICTNYLGKHPAEGSLCDQCNEAFSYAESEKGGTFFLYMPLHDQLQNKFQHENIWEISKKYRLEVKEKSQANVYHCLLDGNNYRRLQILENNEIISLQWNTDGLPVFKSNNYSVWPLQCFINELPEHAKKKHILLAGIWFGKCKPIMQECFLKPFVNELILLKTDGFFITSSTGDLKNIKVFPLICCCDAPARALVQNFIQYNGEFGCSWCYHKGTRIAHGRGFSQVYLPDNRMHALRTSAETLQHAQMALANNHNEVVNGVKGPSTIMKLAPEFDIIDSFTPDYMHAVLLGVCRRLVTLCLSSTVNEKWHIDDKQINAKINNMKVTHEVVREMRNINDVKYFKASEWRTFLLFSPLLFQNLFHNRDYYKHWILLPHAIYLLLGSSITNDDIIHAEQAITKFVFLIRDLYGDGEQTYNAHLLLHLPRSVRSWGPLWAHSAFIFEDHLGKLKKLHHGTKAIPQQIFTTFLHEMAIQKYISKVEIHQSSASNFIMEMRRGYAITNKHTLDSESVKAFGKPECKTFTPEELNALNNYSIHAVLNNNGLFYKRITCKNVLYSTKAYCSNKKRVNFIVELINSNIVEIQNFVIVDQKVFGLGKNLKTQKFKQIDNYLGEMCTYIKKIIQRGQLVAFQPIEITAKFCTFQNNNEIYLLRLPNLTERD